MARAQGARALMALAFETTYGTPPASGFTRMPFASTSLGAEQPLLNSELLGYGRDPLAPVKDAITAMTEAAAPGQPIGFIDDAHRRVFDEAGHTIHRFAACGYALGATYRPTWMDVPPMLYSGNSLIAEPGMVFFLHAMFSNADAGYAMSLGHTLVITGDGREVLSDVPFELPVKA